MRSMYSWPRGPTRRSARPAWRRAPTATASTRRIGPIPRVLMSFCAMRAMDEPRASPSGSLPLERGSNFRDLGGYPAAGGKHVRWGTIYRTGGHADARPMPTSAMSRASALPRDIDLRSTRRAAIPRPPAGEEPARATSPSTIRAATIFWNLAAAGRDAERDREPLPRLADLLGAAIPGDIPRTPRRRRGDLPLFGRPRTGPAWPPPCCCSALGVPRDVIFDRLPPLDRRPSPETSFRPPHSRQYPSNVVARLPI